MDLRERLFELTGGESLEEVLRAAMTSALRDVWTAMPVRITQDSDGKTVMVQPTIKAQVRDEEGNLKHVDLPIAEAIVHHMGGGGVTRTTPIKAENEGIALYASRAADAWHQTGGQQQAVDTRSHSLSDGMVLPGIRSKPRDLKDISTEADEVRSDDGAHRQITHPKNGIKTSVGNGKQVIDVNAITGAIEAKSKTVTLASGDADAGRGSNSANTLDRDLNEQLKGLSARVAQAEKGLHGLFDVTSKFREIVQTQIQAVAAVAPQLGGTPGSLDAMVAAVEGKAQAYLQTQIQQALGAFMNPSIGNIASVLGGAIEGQIEGLKAQIANLVASNPVVAQVEGLQRQVDAVLVRGAAAAVQASQLAPIQAEIKALTDANPIVAEVLDLRAKLQGLIGQAGAGLNFLEPQKRLAQGVIKSVRLAEAN